MIIFIACLIPICHTEWMPKIGNYNMANKLPERRKEKANKSDVFNPDVPSNS